MAARLLRLDIDNAWREKIRASNILHRLIEHAEGKIEMTASQVRTGLALLRKILPDLATLQVNLPPETDLSKTRTPQDRIEMVRRLGYLLEDGLLAAREASEAQGAPIINQEPPNET